MQTRRFVSGERFFELTWEELFLETAEGEGGVEQDPKQQTFTSHRALAEFIETEVKRRLAHGYEEVPVEDGAPRPIPDAAELEALIERDPDATEPYLVYADFLQAHGDPRGELITLQHRKQTEPSAELDAEEARLLAHHPDRFYGPLAGSTEVAQLRFRLGFLTSVTLYVQRVAELDDAVLLKSFVGHPACRFLRELVVCYPDSGDPLSSLVEALAQPPAHPAVVRLQLGDPQGRPHLRVPTTLLPLFPALRELAIFADPLEGALVHGDLSRLVINTTLSSKLFNELKRARLPSLTTLELIHTPPGWGIQNSGGLGLAPTTFPKLRHLALRQGVAEGLSLNLKELFDTKVPHGLLSLELAIPYTDEILDLLVANVGALAHLRLKVGDFAANLTDWTGDRLELLRRAGLTVERAAPWPSPEFVVEMKRPEVEQDPDYDEDEDEDERYDEIGE